MYRLVTNASKEVPSVAKRTSRSFIDVDTHFKGRAQCRAIPKSVTVAIGLLTNGDGLDQDSVLIGISGEIWLPIVPLEQILINRRSISTASPSEG